MYVLLGLTLGRIWGRGQKPAFFISVCVMGPPPPASVLGQKLQMTSGHVPRGSGLGTL